MMANHSSLIDAYKNDELQNQLFLSEYYAALTSDPSNQHLVPDDDETLLKVRRLENGWNLWEETRLEGEDRPTRAEDFLPWYQDVCREIDDCGEPFYKFLADEAPMEGLSYYFLLEEMIDGAFDDTIALAQIGIKGPGKMSLARNYWDEMGRGDPDMVHGYLFNKTAQYMRQVLQKKGIQFKSNLTIPGLKNGNMFSMWSMRRSFSLRMLGGLGVLEDTASRRFSYVVKACERLKVPEDALVYAREHVHVDAIHGKEWVEHLILPMITAKPDCLDELTKGILIRKHVTAEYLNGTARQIQDFLHVV
ncbi:iron-containing redox enzyme family protein [Oligoflexus tunisiensis]|uniref:iron-containing redox enzyme family protein n=1 Tax=Oligoflexus tunisiensis TaxID=708132 RepID=UPI000AC8862B|nr:iron-containing redox enzyme family protein [Oligoflexus tunisiensis]